MIAHQNWKSRAIATPLFKCLCLASYSPAFSTPRNCRFWIIFLATAVGRFAYICMASAPDTLPARNWLKSTSALFGRGSLRLLCGGVSGNQALGIVLPCVRANSCSCRCARTCTFRLPEKHLTASPSATHRALDDLSRS